MRQSTTYTTKMKTAEGATILARHNRPTTKGFALIAARNILGGEARVGIRGAEHCILRPDGTLFASSNKSWDGAIKAARDRVKSEREAQAA